MPVLTKEVSQVSTIASASPTETVAHFSRLLSLETDCWDVHEAIEGDKMDFVLLDVRGPQSHAAGHIPGAVNLPHRRITAGNLASYSEDMLFVVYCGGPHCNGADRAALNIAKLGRRVKKMIGGIEGWKDEGFKLTEPSTPKNDPASK